MLTLDLTQLLIAIALAIPIAFFFTRFNAQPPLIDESQEPYRQKPPQNKPTMQAPKTASGSGPTAPPKSDPYTQQELKQYDGTGPDGKIYVAVKGTIFDVSAKKDMYGPGASYNVFAGKDASRGLGLSSVKPEDAVPDYSGLSAEAQSTLDGWYAFFEKRYNVVGTVSDI